MTAQPLAPLSEEDRQRVLDELRLIGSLPERTYEDIVHIAAALCNAPIALISLLDRDQQWFKARIGVNDARTERNMAVCDHAIQKPEELMEVGDLEHDIRFADNPVIKGVGARFYAGMPLVTTDGAAIGTVCVLDDHPRQLTPLQRKGLEALARTTMTLIESRRRERTHEVAAILEQAAPALAQPQASPSTPLPYSVVIWEVQDLAALTDRLGNRATDRELAVLDQQLEGCLDIGRGDIASRVTGSGEFVVVLHGADTEDRLSALEGLATVTTARLGARVLVGAAHTEGAESAGAVFLRADLALSALKDQTA